MNEIESAGAYHRIDDDTGQPFWCVWGADDKDSEDLDPNKPLTLDPRHFPPGTRVVVIEPPVEQTREFYARPANYYPVGGGASDG